MDRGGRSFLTGDAPGPSGMGDEKVPWGITASGLQGFNSFHAMRTMAGPGSHSTGRVGSNMPRSIQQSIRPASVNNICSNADGTHLHPASVGGMPRSLGMQLSQQFKNGAVSGGTTPRGKQQQQQQQGSDLTSAHSTTWQAHGSSPAHSHTQPIVTSSPYLKPPGSSNAAAGSGTSRGGGGSRTSGRSDMMAPEKPDKWAPRGTSQEGASPRVPFTTALSAPVQSPSANPGLGAYAKAREVRVGRLMNAYGVGPASTSSGRPSPTPDLTRSSAGSSYLPRQNDSAGGGSLGGSSAYSSPRIAGRVARGSTGFSMDTAAMRPGSVMAREAAARVRANTVGLPSAQQQQGLGQLAKVGTVSGGNRGSTTAVVGKMPAGASAAKLRGSHVAGMQEQPWGRGSRRYDWHDAVQETVVAGANSDSSDDMSVEGRMAEGTGEDAFGSHGGDTCAIPLIVTAGDVVVGTMGLAAEYSSSGHSSVGAGSGKGDLWDVPAGRDSTWADSPRRGSRMSGAGVNEPAGVNTGQGLGMQIGSFNNTSTTTNNNHIPGMNPEILVTSMSYDDIPVIEQHLEGFDGQEEEEYGGMTLDMFMAQMNTTPASQAATSGLGHHEDEPFVPNQEPIVPTYPPARVANTPTPTLPAGASHSTQPQFQTNVGSAGSGSSGMARHGPHAAAVMLNNLDLRPATAAVAGNPRGSLGDDSSNRSGGYGSYADHEVAPIKQVDLAGLSPSLFTPSDKQQQAGGGAGGAGSVTSPVRGGVGGWASPASGGVGVVSYGSLASLTSPKGAPSRAGGHSGPSSLNNPGRMLGSSAWADGAGSPGPGGTMSTFKQSPLHTGGPSGSGSLLSPIANGPLVHSPSSNIITGANNSSGNSLLAGVPSPSGKQTMQRGFSGPRTSLDSSAAWALAAARGGVEVMDMLVEADEGSVAAAAAAALVRPAGPTPGGVRQVQSARPGTRGDMPIDPTVWKNYISVQLERPPSRQRPPSEALHLWSPLTANSSVPLPVPANPASGPRTDGLGAGTGSRPTVRPMRPHSAAPVSSSGPFPSAAAAAVGGGQAVPLSSGGRVGSVLSGAAVPHGFKDYPRPPSRQKPPPMSVLNEAGDEFGAVEQFSGTGAGSGGGAGAPVAWRPGGKPVSMHKSAW